jgi:LuxR family transcriptional regulator, maltose regulon positive regulatory protein
MLTLPEPSLLARLDAAMSYRLTLLITPAGDGEEAPEVIGRLLGDWTARARWPVYRIALGPHHNDPARFCRALTTSLSPVTGPMVLDGSSPEACVVEIVNAIALSVAPWATESVSDFALVLDGYEAIASLTIHEALVLMLDYLPPPMHVVIASAGVPPLVNIPRLRARRQLLQISLR